MPERSSFLPYAEHTVPTDLVIDLNAESRAIAEAWHPAAAIKFNNTMNNTEARQCFLKNMQFLLRKHDIVTEKAEDQAKQLGEKVGLSEILAHRVLTGIGTYIHTCFVCEKLNVGLGTMFDKELANEPFLSRIALRQTA